MTLLTKSIFLSDATASDSLATWGERAIIEKLRAWLDGVSPNAPHGIGDDCAIISIPAGRRQLFTTDHLTYGLHFDEQLTGEEAGMKLVKRNLSDIAAMGGEAGPALLTLLCGPDLSVPWLETFISGIRKACLKYGTQIIGGDVSELGLGSFSAGLAQTGTIGHAAKLRNTARIGDQIYVTGRLGGSLLGKHFLFEPRLAEGRWLAANPECTAMMDLTDGLAKDLDAVLPESSSAAVQIDKLPIAPAANECAKSTRKSAIEHAFCDGEDYELLFCCSKDVDEARFHASWNEAFPNLQIRRIGTIEHPGKARYVDAKTAEPLCFESGFEHFLPR
jgi:thiamine-monophosphate kinase